MKPVFRAGFKHSRAKLDLMVAAWDGAIRMAARHFPDLFLVDCGTSEPDRDNERRVAHFRLGDRYHLYHSITIRELDAMLIADIDEKFAHQRLNRDYEQMLIKFAKVDPSLHPVTMPDPDLLTKAVPAPAPLGLAQEPEKKTKSCPVDGCGQPMRVTESIQKEDAGGKTEHFRVLVWECENPLHRPVIEAEKLR